MLKVIKCIKKYFCI